MSLLLALGIRCFRRMSFMFLMFQLTLNHLLRASTHWELNVQQKKRCSVISVCIPQMGHPLSSTTPMLLSRCFVEFVMTGEPDHKATFRNDSSVPNCVCATYFVCGPYQIFLYNVNGILRDFHPVSQCVFYPAKFFDHPARGDGSIEEVPSTAFHIYLVYPFYPQRVLQSFDVPRYFTPQLLCSKFAGFGYRVHPLLQVYKPFPNSHSSEICYLFHRAKDRSDTLH